MFTFNTGLTEEAFSRCRLAEYIAEEGMIAEAAGDKTTFRPWSFGGIKTSEKAGEEGASTVLLCGDDWGEQPMPLLSLLDASSDEAGREAASKAVCAAISAMQSSCGVPCNGAGGIYVSQDMKRILFLPPVLFDKAASFKGAGEYARLQGVWQCGSSDDAVNKAFTAASIAYYALTGNAPYGNADAAMRAADIYDKKYLPLELSLNGVDASLAHAADCALDAPSIIAHSKGGGASPPIPAIDTKVLCSEILLGRYARRQNAIGDDEFKALACAFYRRQDGQVKTSRALRRNTSILIGAAVALCVAVWVGVSSYKNAMSLPTMKGLTSSEVAQVFYQAINGLDVQMVTLAAKGKVAKDVGDGLSQVFVSGKMRSMYEEGGIVTLDEWLIRHEKGAVPKTVGVYSITHFALDGAQTALNVKVPMRREKPAAVTLDGGAVISDGSTALHTAQYCFVHTEGEEQDFFCERHTDKVTLTYKRGEWRVTDVEESVEDIAVDSASFYADLEAAIKSCGGDVPKAVGVLKDKYTWLIDM